MPHWDETTASIAPYGQGCTNQNYKLDVGGNSSENFTEEETMLALSFYDPQATVEMKQRLEQLRILSNMRIALWCLIMSRTSTLDHPYQQWTDELFLEIKNGLKLGWTN